MMRRNLAFVFIWCTVIFSFFGCASRTVEQVQDTSEDMPENFVARPRFEKAVPRPLGRVLLQWNRINEAAGYEIQMSGDQDFTIIEKSWTVRGLNLELPLGYDEGRWFRIRSFTEQSRSQWSAPLKVVMSEL